MITDLTLLKLLATNRATALQYKPQIKLYTLSDEGKVVFKDIFKYYNTFAVESIDIGQFSTWFHQVQHPDLNETKHSLYHEFFKQLANETYPDGWADAVIQHYKKEALKKKLVEKLDTTDYTSSELRKMIDNYEAEVSQYKELDFVNNKATNFIVRTQRTEGLVWRLGSLNQSIGRLIPGDFGIIAAYVDTGKTTFLASEVSYMAQQITDGSVLWFNNEGPEDRIQTQIRQATLGMTRDEIAKDIEAADARYTDLMHGDIDRIKIFEATGFTIEDIRVRAERYNAKLIIIDMLDHFTGESSAKDAEVIRLKHLYRDIRNISKDFCPVLGTSQCDGSVVWKDRETGETVYQEWIGQHQLDYSRVVKQAAAEFIITIGRNVNYPLTRSIHVPKNKLPGCGKELYRNTKERVNFNGAKSLYTDAI